MQSKNVLSSLLLIALLGIANGAHAKLNALTGTELFGDEIQLNSTKQGKQTITTLESKTTVITQVQGDNNDVNYFSVDNKKSEELKVYDLSELANINKNKKLSASELVSAAESGLVTCYPGFGIETGNGSFGGSHWTHYTQHFNCSNGSSFSISYTYYHNINSYFIDSIQA